MLDAGGGVIAAAAVRRLERLHFGPLTRSGADGRYRLCLAAGPARLRVDAPGYGARVFAVSAEGERLDLSLEPEALLIGTTVGERGEPLAGVQVNAWPHGESAAAVTTVSGEDGRFQLGGLSRGQYRLNAWLRDGTTWYAIDLRIDDAGSWQTRTIELSATSELAGRVLRAGAPVVGARVYALRGGDRDARSFLALTQPDGTFVLHGASRGPVELLVDDQSVLWLMVDRPRIAGLDIALAPPEPR